MVLMFYVPHFLTKTWGGVLRKNNGENSILYLLKNAICDEILSILCFLENGSYITLSLKNVSAFLRCATTGVWFLQLIWPHLVGGKENEIIFPGFWKKIENLRNSWKIDFKFVLDLFSRSKDDTEHEIWAGTVRENLCMPVGQCVLSANDS